MHVPARQENKGARNVVVVAAWDDRDTFGPAFVADTRLGRHSSDYTILPGTNKLNATKDGAREGSPAEEQYQDECGDPGTLVPLSFAPVQECSHKIGWFG